MRQQNVLLNTKEIALIGMMAAAMEAAKLALSFLPNIEPVTLLIILYTLFLGKKVLYVIAAFILMEGCFYGFGIWWLMYLYAWPFLAWPAYLLRKKENAWPFAVLAGTFGLGFGALCAIPYFFIGGPAMAFSWWVAGIPYDIVHGVANFVLCLVLFKPLWNVLKRLKQQ